MHSIKDWNKPNISGGSFGCLIENQVRVSFFAEKKVAVRKVVRLIEPIMGNTLAHPYKTQNLSVKCNITENI